MVSLMNFWNSHRVFEIDLRRKNKKACAVFGALVVINLYSHKLYKTRRIVDNKQSEYSHVSIKILIRTCNNIVDYHAYLNQLTVLSCRDIAFSVTAQKQKAAHYEADHHQPRDCVWCITWQKIILY